MDEDHGDKPVILLKRGDFPDDTSYEEHLRDYGRDLVTRLQSRVGKSIDTVNLSTVNVDHSETIDSHTQIVFDPLASTTLRGQSMNSDYNGEQIKNNFNVSVSTDVSAASSFYAPFPFPHPPALKDYVSLNAIYTNPHNDCRKRPSKKQSNTSKPCAVASKDVRKLVRYIKSMCQDQRATVITVEDMEAAFRKYKIALTLKRDEEVGRMLMEALSDLLNTCNLQPVEWFNMIDSKRAIYGSDDKLNYLELSLGLTKLCDCAGLPRWRENDIQSLLTYIDTSKDGTLSVEEFEVAFKKYKNPHFNFILLSTGPMMERIENFLMEEKLRVQDLFNSIDTNGTGFLTEQMITEELPKILDHGNSHDHLDAMNRASGYAHYHGFIVTDKPHSHCSPNSKARKEASNRGSISSNANSRSSGRLDPLNHPLSLSLSQESSCTSHSLMLQDQDSHQFGRGRSRLLPIDMQNPKSSYTSQEVRTGPVQRRRNSDTKDNSLQSLSKKLTSRIKLDEESVDKLMTFSKQADDEMKWKAALSSKQWIEDSLSNPANPKELKQKNDKMSHVKFLKTDRINLHGQNFQKDLVRVLERYHDVSSGYDKKINAWKKMLAKF